MEASNLMVNTLKGVGAQRIQQLTKLGIHSVGDLLTHYPRGYLDLTEQVQIMEAPLDKPCTIEATVVKKSNEIQLRGGLKMYKVIVEDTSGPIELVFFNTKYTVDTLKYDTPYLFYGRVLEGSFLHRTMNTPVVYPAELEHKLVAVYPLTAGLSTKMLSILVKQALQLKVELPEVLPEEIREGVGLCGIQEAVRKIHCPDSAEDVEQARQRLIFEELFTLAVGVGMLKNNAYSEEAFQMQPHSLEPFYNALPFELTGAQQRAINDLKQDLQKHVPANRLVQGDVGSGKTMVAAAGAYFAFLSGAQSAMMVPTELLAEQHYKSLAPLLEKLGMYTAILTGSMTQAQKRAIRQGLSSGEIDFCIGTHALLSDGVDFQTLALVITDEQHRFGVAQRAALREKGKHAHTLVMSATPIPRTLALMVYGELDISIIDELPPNRHPVLTYKISSPKRERAFHFIRQHLDKGLQAYIVCPLIEAGEETTGMQPAKEYMEGLCEGPFTGYRVGLLHGRMKAADKERIMSEFKEGTVQLLVSTTVVEVGVDVPNAVIMMIENAERFGLSQLHQLRGRVGRGKEQSYCILLSDNRSPDTLERLQMLCKSSNGFEITEYDLKTRGPGNFLGQQQHGLPQFKIADLAENLDMVSLAQEAAGLILKADPLMEAPGHVALKQAVSKLMDAIGDRPN